VKINDQVARTADLGISHTQQRPASMREAVPSRPGAGAPAASVTLSSRSRELHAALALARESSDVRPAVVADVRSRIEAGTYDAEPKSIARAMLDRRA
jgi:flagellar biosynthesis anti-sigma factor FlgM